MSENRTYWLLHIIDKMGGETDASDGSWIAAFCDDRDGAADTFNRAINNKLLSVWHDNRFDTSTAKLTPAGRAFLLQEPHP